MKFYKIMCDGCGKEFSATEVGQVEFTNQIENSTKLFYTFDFCATCGAQFCMELLENYIKDSKIQDELIESLAEKRRRLIRLEKKS